MLEQYIEIDSDLPNIENERGRKMTKSIESELLDGLCFFMPAYQLVLVLHSLLYKSHQLLGEFLLDSCHPDAF